MISLLALFCYALIPLAGLVISRRGWRRFRVRFDRLRLASTLDYARYIACGRAPEGPAGAAKIFRFTGSFESVTDGQTLWVQGPDLTIPVALAGARLYTLPVMETRDGDFDLLEGNLQRLRWDRVASLTGEARVFVGGPLALREGRRIFAAAPGEPLLVIFYTGPDRSMAVHAAWAGRRRNEYWNAATPYALTLGALSLIAMAAAFLPRPAFRLTAITAFAAAFVPLFPMAPPGLLFTLMYRWLWRRAQIYRVYGDLARLPLVYFPVFFDGPENLRFPARLPGGEYYGARCYRELPEGTPLLIPGMKRSRKEPWYLFGALGGPEDGELGAAETEVAGTEDTKAGIAGPGDTAGFGAGEAAEITTTGPEDTETAAVGEGSAEDPREGGPAPGQGPREPKDSFAAFGAVPGNPERLARRCTRYARLLEALSWFLLLGGVGLNAFFIVLIVTLL